MVWSSVWQAVRGVAARQQANVAALGYFYPLWYFAAADIAAVYLAGASVVQRHALFPPDWPLLAGLATVGPLLWIVFAPPRNRLAGAAMVIAAVEVLVVLRPVPEDSGFGAPDAAPGCLWLIVLSMAAVSTPWAGLPIAAIAIAALAVDESVGRLSAAQVQLNISGIAMSWMFGFMLQAQMRALQSEREAQAIRAERAAGDERRRIAREVHDIAGHSLAITLLHLTGARRALEHDRDIDEAVDALGDAERIGRQAMSDIRRTVGLLNDDAKGNAPEPGIADIDDLIADFLAAGLRVKYTLVGDPEAVSGAVGASLYRITRESLTNVVKHAAAAMADVELTITEKLYGSAVALSVRNDAPRARSPKPGGSGIRGMRQRAEALGGTLKAGPDGGVWIVRVEVPLS